jgi:hypothetical protein
MRTFMTYRLAQTLPLVLFLACQNVTEQFIGTRVLDTCDGTWPVCDGTVGCLVGERSFLTGRFPGKNQVAVRLAEPSKVTISLLLTETQASGTQAVFNFYEDRCRARIRTEVPGKTFVTENEQIGFVERSAELIGEGDHLLEFESDSKTRYTAKVDVLPLRLLQK